MTTEIKKETIKLINKSKALSKEKKQTYLKAVNFLSESKIKELFVLLEKEQKALRKIEAERNAKKIALNKEYIEEIDKIYSREMKSGILSTEKDEKEEATNILKNIDKV